MKNAALLTALLVLAAPRPSAAQQGSEPEAQPSIAAPRWSLSLRMQQARDSNPALSTGSQEGSWVTSLGGAAFRSFRGRRAHLALSGEAALERYHSLRGLDQVRWSGMASSEARLSERARLSMEASASSTYARDLQSFLEHGLLLPATPVRRLAGAAELSRRVSVATTLSGWARHQRVDFESDDLAGGSEWAVGATMGRSLGPRHDLALTYAVRRSSSDAQRDLFHAASAGWRGTLARRLSGDVTVGIVYRAADGTERPFDFEAAAGLGYRARRFGFGAHYGRTVHQAYGFSVPHLADVGSVRVDWRPAPALTLVASSSYGSSRDPIRHSFDFRSRTHVVDAHWSPRRLLTFSSGYAYLRRAPSDSVSVSVNHIWKTSLAVGRSWQ